jgi:hypothetical protein
MTEFFQPLAAVPLDALPLGLAINSPPEVKKEEIEAVAPELVLPALPDLNIPTPEEKKEENLDAASPLTLLMPSPEARVLLRRFAVTMAGRPAGIRTGTWSPTHLGLTGRIGELGLNGAVPHLPSFVEGSSRC